MESRIVNLVQAREWAFQLAQEFSSKQLVLLSGDLGAGKSQWVRFFVEAFGGQIAASPTYGIVSEVPLGKVHSHLQSSRLQGLNHCFHVDLYRLENTEQIESSGFWELFEAPKGLVFVEWPERVPQEDFPTDWQTLRLNMEAVDADHRKVSVTLVL